MAIVRSEIVGVLCLAMLMLSGAYEFSALEDAITSRGGVVGVAAAASPSLIGLRECSSLPNQSRHAMCMQIRTKVDVGPDGVRGLFAKEAVPPGGLVASIPSRMVMNVGSESGSFLVRRQQQRSAASCSHAPHVQTPVLMVQREMLDRHSRFRPYLDTLPKPGTIFNQCTLPISAAKILQSEFWVRINLSPSFCGHRRCYVSSSCYDL